MHTNIHIIWVPEGEEREKRGVKIELNEICLKTSQGWRKKDIQVQEAQRIPNNMNLNRPTPGHIMAKMAKVR